MIIKLTDEEKLEMQALAIELHTTPAKIIEKFVADLTGSLRSNGSDERMYAEQWKDRNYWPGPDLTNAQRDKIDRLRSASYQLRQQKRAQWQAQIAANMPLTN